MNKVCPKCETEKSRSEFYKNRSRSDGLQGICKDCCREYDRKRWLLYPEKTKARVAVHYALKTGRLTRPDHCESCLKKRFAESHHEDYSKKLDVEWLCKKCHVERRKVQ